MNRSQLNQRGVLRIVQIGIGDKQNQIGSPRGDFGQVRAVFASHLVDARRIDQNDFARFQPCHSMASPFPGGSPNLFRPATLNVDFNHFLTDQRINHCRFAGADLAKDYDLNATRNDLFEHLVQLTNVGLQLLFLSRRAASQFLQRGLNGGNRILVLRILIRSRWSVHGQLIYRLMKITKLV